MAPLDQVILTTQFFIWYPLVLAISGGALLLTTVIYILMLIHREKKIVVGRGPTHLHHLFLSNLGNALLVMVFVFALQYQLPLVVLWLLILCRHFLSILTNTTLISFQIGICLPAHFTIEERVRFNKMKFYLSILMVCYLPVFGIGVLTVIFSDPASLNSRYQLYYIYLVLLFSYFGVLFGVWSVYLYWNQNFDRYYSRYWLNRFARVFSTFFYLTKLLLSLVYYRSGDGNLLFFDGAQLCDAFFEVLVISGIFLCSVSIPCYAIVMGREDWIRWYERHDQILRSATFPLAISHSISDDTRIHHSEGSRDSSFVEDRHISVDGISVSILPTIQE